MRVVMTIAALAAALSGSVAGAAAPPGGGGLIVFSSQRASDFRRVELLTTSRVEDARALGLLPEGAAPAPDSWHRYARAVFTRSPWRFDLVVGTEGGPEQVVATTDDPIYDITWSPAGRRIAYTIADTSRCGPADHLCAVFELWVVNADGTGNHKIFDGARLPTWSPDGRRLAFAGRWNTYDANERIGTGTPYVAFADGGGVRPLARVRGIRALAWAPRGDRLAFAANRGYVAVVSTRGGDARIVGRGSAPAWSPGGQLAFAAAGGDVRIVRPDGRLVRRIRANGTVEDVVWSQMRSDLAYVTHQFARQRPPSGSRLVVLVRPDGRARRVVFRGDGYAIVRLAGWHRLDPGPRVMTTRFDNDEDLFTMRGDGGAIRQVTANDDWETDPSWSPDGRRIAFVRVFPGGFGFPQTAVNVVDVDGRRATRITSPTAGTDDLDPEWSPDGTWIVFSRSLAASGLDESELFMCRPDGAGLVQLTRLGGSNSHPAWSPDGTRIAFSHSGELWMVDPDGRNARSLGLRGGQPSWSHDGRRIAYVGVIGNVPRLLVADADGSDHRVVSWDATPFWRSPAWSPDNSLLVYQGMDEELHSIGVDGANDVALTDTPGLDEAPDWSGSAGG